MNDLTGILYIVATPIGNLQDITQRALETFSQVDLIAAEDTRHSGLLLSHYGIKKPFFALHDHNEQEKAHLLVEKLKQGTNIALISDDKLESSLIAGILNHISRKHIVTIPNCNKNLNVLKYPEKSV